MKQTEAYPHLLDAEHIGGQTRWLGGRILAARHEKAAAEIAAKSIPAPYLGVIVDARRPKNPPALAARRSDPGVVLDKINRSLASIGQQDYPPERVVSPIVLVDPVLPIKPRERARLKETVGLVPVPTLHGIDHGLNWGFRQLQSDGRAVAALILDAGSHYATNQAFRAAVEETQEKDAFAAFGGQLADGHASPLQSVARNLHSLSQPPTSGYVSASEESLRFVPADGTVYNLGRLGGTAPFYHGTNPLRANTRTLLAAGSSGEFICYNPALAVQSGEALGPIALLNQAMEPSRQRPPLPPPPAAQPPAATA